MTRGAQLSWMILTAVFLSGPPPARGQAAAQRTMGTAPSGSSSGAQPDSIDNLLRQYRGMWQKMSPAQQKAFLDAGGSTPEQYERTLRAKGMSALPPSPTPVSAGRAAQSDPHTTVNALDSLTTSLQDLNAIRDGNLGRVQKDGCPPEVASRIAVLRTRLRQDESRLNGSDAPASAAEKPKDHAAGDPMAIASDWFKDPPKEANSTGTQAAPPAGTHESKLLDSVLVAQPSPATSPSAKEKALEPQDRKELEDEIARIKAEIAQLSAACMAIQQ